MRVRLPPPPRSVRARTTAVGTAVALLALLLGAWLLVTVLERSLTRSADDQARARVDDLAALAASGDLPDVVAGIGDDSVAQVVLGAEVIASSPNIAGKGPISTFVPSGDGPEVRTMRGLPDDDEDEDYRIWVKRTATPEGPAVVYVGPSLESAQEAAARLTSTLAVGLPLLVLVLAGLTWLVVGRALRPVEEIRREVARLGADRLDHRVPVPATDDEVADLARTMNDMLGRLEDADARQQEFVANASHDLQSPLTAFRTELEVALAHPDRTDWVATARSLHAEGRRMETLVQDLLYLARSEQRLDPPAPRLVDLDDLVREEAARAGASSSVQLHTRLTAAPVRGHRDDLARLVRNLLDNALRHAERHVAVSLVEGGGAVILLVEDDGPGVPEADRERIFDRFFRGDSARDRSTSGTGLGLAIVRSIAEAHGGSARLAGASRFEVRLPTG